jgi:hypothetical protein
VRGGRDVGRRGDGLDPANDFIPTFAGVHSADLDVQSVFATYDGVNLHIGATLTATSARCRAPSTYSAFTAAPAPRTSRRSAFRTSTSMPSSR